MCLAIKIQAQTYQLAPDVVDKILGIDLRSDLTLPTRRNSPLEVGYEGRKEEVEASAREVVTVPRVEL